MMENKNNIKLYSDFLSLPSNPEDLFTLLYPISKNKNNEIYKAIYKTTRELFAIKILPYSKFINNNPNSKEIQDNFLFSEKIKQQSLILKNTYNNEYIIKYYGSFLSLKTNSIWLIFEYCNAGSIIDLTNVIERNLTEEEISIIANMILHALLKLNQVNIIHRNINSSNILLNSNGKIKLNNFTDAIQLLNYELSLNNANNNNEFDNKYDIFLLGITCIEIFKGKIDNVFYRKDLINTINSIKNCDHLYSIVENEIDIRGEYDTYTVDFIEFLCRCLENQPSRRANAYELINHSFIKKYNNQCNINNLTELIKKNIEKIENNKKTNYEANKTNFNYINFINSIIINKKSKNENNSTINLFDEKNITNLSNINITDDNKSHYVDKLAEFRIEQMQNEAEVDCDKFTNNDFLVDNNISNLNNTECRYITQNSQENKSLKKSAVFGFKENVDIKMNNTFIDEKKDLINELTSSKNSDESGFKQKWEHLNKYNDLIKSRLSDKDRINSIHDITNPNILNINDDPDNSILDKYINDVSVEGKCGDIYYISSIKNCENLNKKQDDPKSTEELSSNNYILYKKDSTLTKNKMTMSSKNRNCFTLRNTNEVPKMLSNSISSCHTYLNTPLTFKLSIKRNKYNSLKNNSSFCKNRYSFPLNNINKEYKKNELINKIVIKEKCNIENENNCNCGCNILNNVENCNKKIYNENVDDDAAEINKPQIKILVKKKLSGNNIRFKKKNILNEK